jgi:hypothetical protein
MKKLTPRLLPRSVFVYTEIDPDTGCWWWNGCKDRSGYGSATHEGMGWPAHRLTYTLLVGEIPHGLVIDHLCRNPSCVNPDHLEPVSHAININRGINANRNKTRCKNGHPYIETNTRVVSGSRRCMICKRASDARGRERKRANDHMAAK